MVRWSLPSETVTFFSLNSAGWRPFHQDMPTVHFARSSFVPSNSSLMGSYLTHLPAFCWSESGKASVTCFGVSPSGPVRSHILLGRLSAADFAGEGLSWA